MFEESVVSAFEVPLDLPENTCEASLEVSIEPAKTLSEVRSKSAKEIAEEFGVSDKTVQTWFKVVCAAYTWIEPEALKTGKSAKTRYTPLCQSLIAEYRAVAAELSEEDWITLVHAANPDLETATSSALSASDAVSTEVMLQEGEQSIRGAFHGGVAVHISSSLALPAIPVLIPPGDDTAYLMQIQQKLQQFERLQQQAIVQMQAQHEQAQALNAQYQEATSLSDQLLLKEFQLKGVQLGYAALQLKQQAFKATVQAAEAGTLPAPGKPQPEKDQLQSA